jgi:hypothetical protein
MDNVLSKVKSTFNDILGKATEAPQFLQKNVVHPIVNKTMEIKVGRPTVSPTTPSLNWK